MAKQKKRGTTAPRNNYRQRGNGIRQSVKGSNFPRGNPIVTAQIMDPNYPPTPNGPSLPWPGGSGSSQTTR